MSGRFPTERLRPVLEAAVRVAREGEDADPVEPAPAALRRYLHFARLPSPALEVARRVLDDDAGFRARVAEATHAEAVGEPAWLWLSRPEGWERRLAELAADAERRRSDAKEGRDEQSARRKIASLEEALRRAEVAGEGHAASARRARDEVDAERLRRREAERTASRTSDELERSRQEADRLRGDLDDARRQLDEVRRQLDDARIELEANRTRLAEVANAPMTTGESGHADVDHEALAAAVADAVDAASRVTEALTAASALVPPAERAAGPEPDQRSGPARLPTARRADRRGGSGRRRPVALPGGMLDDGIEAAEHLVRVPGVLLLVDGYNVSHAVWPGLPLVEQRGRLVDALGELQARTGAMVEVVFDGALSQGPWVEGGRHAVHIRFSPPDTEADDVLVDVIAAQPPTRPVVLATSDRELRARARRLGANLLGARQLLAAMHR